MLGRGSHGVVGIGPDRDLVVAQLTADGLGDVRALSTGPVRSAAMSLDGTVVAWVDQDRGYHEHGTTDGAWSWEAASQGGFVGTLLAVDGGDQVVRRDGRVVLERPRSGHAPSLLAPVTAEARGQLAGGVAAVAGPDHVALYAPDSDVWPRQVPARAGALSPTGAQWAGGDTVVATSTGAAEVLDGDLGGVPVAAWWSSAQDYWALTAVGGARSLWSCSLIDHACVQRYVDRTGTLALPG
ncbi:hypothetical protein G5V58_01975 [Nocardioides anomalus]|uniref:Uncharacterized protein n=1 Tax=Nocardioides anomalus TaxID=2712223 RepID=A0A6G6W970_9ACTN|nr:hypothetical protein [Nocardioides anomalus]QIG41703.1 hypothetical protein G5V58_01975 [Nocardioides anomalus]